MILDGIGNQMAYESNTWGNEKVGQTNLKPNKVQTIVIKRTGSQLNVALDGKEWNVIPISASITAVGWRPWRNIIHIKDLGVIFGIIQIK